MGREESRDERTLTDEKDNEATLWITLRSSRETDHFLETHKLSQVTHEEIDKLNILSPPIFLFLFIV